MRLFSSDYEGDGDDGSMFGPKKGCWYVEAKTDGCLNANGEGYGLCCSGGPDGIDEWIKYCKEKFGQRPTDLTIGFMKY